MAKRKSRRTNAAAFEELLSATPPTPPIRPRSGSVFDKLVTEQHLMYISDKQIRFDPQKKRNTFKNKRPVIVMHKDSRRMLAILVPGTSKTYFWRDNKKWYLHDDPYAVLIPEQACFRLHRDTWFLIRYLQIFLAEEFDQMQGIQLAEKIPESYFKRLQEAMQKWIEDQRRSTKP
ncbi:MAG: hypothetical protein Q9P14_15985 [candidate division KSB1 bacterium]|nr:hypothetical protein [candidate division KSB1 bacterium]MDQ7064211.1 hypothetical protein [candidate division KSB1 bacterium]